MDTNKPELRSWDGKLEQGLDRLRVGKATPGKFCTRWLQARRARSDAPYRAGLAAGLFDCIAHFGVRDKPTSAVAGTGYGVRTGVFHGDKCVISGVFEDDDEGKWWLWVSPPLTLNPSPH